MYASHTRVNQWFPMEKMAILYARYARYASGVAAPLVLLVLAYCFTDILCNYEPSIVLVFELYSTIYMYSLLYAYCVRIFIMFIIV